MYEHGMRLGREVPSKQGLQKQAHCYLAAMNALRLVNPMYAWIVKPAAGTETQVRRERERERTLHHSTMLIYNADIYFHRYRSMNYEYFVCFH